MIDAQNKLSHHISIVILSSLFAYILWLSGIRTGRVIAAIPFFLLFLVLIIGPLVKIWPCITKIPPKEFPCGVRAELGIWFVIWSIIHVLFVFSNRNWEVMEYLKGMSPWAFGAFIAIFMGIVLAATSFKGAIIYLGADSWKWLQNFTYVIFWLTAVHVIDRALLRPGFPPTDGLHWAYLIMFAIVPILQLAGFIKTVKEYRQNLNQNLNIENSKRIKKKR